MRSGLYPRDILRKKMISEFEIFGLWLIGSYAVFMLTLLAIFGREKNKEKLE